MDDFDPTAPPRVLSWGQAQCLGYTASAIKHRIVRGEWRRLLPRTYLTRDTVTWNDRLWAAVVFAGPGALLSGAAALCDSGLTTVQRPRSLLVLAPSGRGSHSTDWVRVRRSIRPMAAELLPGPPRVTAARAVADLALERRDIDSVRALVADAVRREMCSIDELMAELLAGPRRNSAFLRQAIDEVAAGAWSAPEARAAAALREAQVPPFEQNARIDLLDGRWRYADFLWRELRAILEIDSERHHGLPPQRDATRRRHDELVALGYHVEHRTPRFVRNHPAEFVDGITRWLATLAVSSS